MEKVFQLQPQQVEVHMLQTFSNPKVTLRALKEPFALLATMPVFAGEAETLNMS